MRVLLSFSFFRASRVDLLPKPEVRNVSVPGRGVEVRLLLSFAIVGGVVECIVKQRQFFELAKLSLWRKVREPQDIVFLVQGEFYFRCPCRTRRAEQSPGAGILLIGANCLRARARFPRSFPLRAALLPLRRIGIWNWSNWCRVPGNYVGFSPPELHARRCSPVNFYCLVTLAHQAAS